MCTPSSRDKAAINASLESLRLGLKTSDFSEEIYQLLVCRPGRPGKSGACGALIKALSDLKEEGLDENCKTPGGMLLSLNASLVYMVDVPYGWLEFLIK